MKHIIYDKIIVDAGSELIPSIKIHPFNNAYLQAASNYETTRAKEYLDSRMGEYKIFAKGRDALYNALQYYKLQRDDIVTILTTSNNFYISGCVTREVEKICKWNRQVSKETRVIIFNHEFGFPCRNIKEVAQYGLPIIEDCAHTFYDEDSEIGKYSDFVVYSLPKAFPMQMGGILRNNKNINFETNSAVEKYVLSNIAIHIDRIDHYKEVRRNNFKYLCHNLHKLGITPYFMDEKAVPGVFLFKWEEKINYNQLKEFMYLNGVECSVFYGQNAFFIPIHQELKKNELDYMIALLNYFKENYYNEE